MGTYRPKLMEAVTASDRMDALCAFIAFWLGPRQPSYGESAQALSERPLPMPLKRLYEFAGRWTSETNPGPIAYVVPALSHQDNLMAFDRLKTKEDGKIEFLSENQGNWNCRTLAEGDDPPVWCYGCHMDEEGKWYKGEKLVCESLSRFLVTFVLQEIAFGSRLCLCDERLDARFESERDRSIPVWTDGPYVDQDDLRYYLWGDVLVAERGDYFFAANNPEGIEFLTENQGTVNQIGLMVSQPWRLDIRPDGSARIRYAIEQTEETVAAPAGTFDFPALLETLSAAASEEGHCERNAVVFFYRNGQSGLVEGKHVHDRNLITSLFRLAIEKARVRKLFWVRRSKALERRFETEWPL